MNLRKPFTWILLTALVAPALAQAQALNRVEERDFGKTRDGTVVKQFTLRNAKGMIVRVMSYGAIINEIEAPDRNGAFTNVVLGADTFDKYMGGYQTSAAIIGRVANRIAGAHFTLDGVEYKLAANDGTNTLHGGRSGFANMVWQGKAVPATDQAAGVRFTHFSTNGEQNFPGNLTASITYTLTDGNELHLDYEATTDKATLVNLTCHAYFNLAGGGGVGGIELWLAADHYTVFDDHLIPTGEIASVAGTPLDFTTKNTIGARMSQIKRGFYDDNFVINGGGKSLVLAARARDPQSGRVLEVRTTQPGVQFYTGNRGGFCLETQHYPDSIHHPEFPSIVLRPGETFKSTTVYAFSAK